MMISILYIIFKIICVLIPVLVAVAYYTYAERKVIGYLQDRIGPNRVGVWGLLQPFADGIKLAFKEVILPTNADPILYRIAPILSFSSALAAWAVMPFDSHLILADANLGLLYLLTMTSVAIYGVIISGWASNSRYALLGSLRSAAQIISYEIPMGFALVGVVMSAGSMQLKNIVLAQNGNILTWFWLPLLPLFIIYWVSAFAETNRAPFDLAEGESEIVAGFHVEYSGLPFALFFLAEYSNMLLVSMLASIMFLGGWLSPFQGIPGLEYMFMWVPGLVWLIIKTTGFAYMMLWVRATFPRFRYDQLMRLGWKVFIPITLVWLVIIAFFIRYA